jgi:hypothetical protein
MAVNDIGARDKMDRLIAQIKEAVQTGTENALAIIKMEVVARTPTMEQEYNLLMVGEGNTTDVPMSGGSSQDPDGRKRLIKSEDSYLENANANPANYYMAVDDGVSYIGVGNLAWLLLQTHYRYQNYTKRGLFPPTDRGPYFNFIENGGSKTISPAYSGGRKGGYPLWPNSGTPVKSITKSITARRMFDKSTHTALFREEIELAFAQVGPSSR